MDRSPSKVAVALDQVQLLSLILAELRALRRETGAQHESIQAISVIPPFTSAEDSDRLRARPA